MDCIKLMESLSLDNNNPSEQNPTFYKSVCVKINDIETEIIYANHTDKVFLVISQYQKLGALLMIKKEQVEGLDKFGEVVYTVTPVFGEENPTQQAAARYIAENLDIQKPLCLFMCLTNYNQDTVNTLVTVLKDIKEEDTENIQH